MSTRKLWRLRYEGLLILLLLPAMVTTAGERRTLPVSVIDSQGRAVHGLTEAALRAEFQGEQVKIVSAVRAGSACRVALLVDISNSMRGGTWQLARRLAENAVAHLTPKHELALLSFDVELAQHAGFTRDKQELEQLLSRMRVGGGSRFYDAILGVARSWPSARPGDALLLITDGEDTWSNAKRREVSHALSRAGLRFFVFLLKGRRHEWVRKWMETELAPSTGGLVRPSASTKMRLADYLAQAKPVYESISNFYLLEVELPQRVEKASEWKLEVVDEKGKQLKGVTISYPRLLLPVESSPIQ